MSHDRKINTIKYVSFHWFIIQCIRYYISHVVVLFQLKKIIITKFENVKLRLQKESIFLQFISKESSWTNDIDNPETSH